MLRKVVVYAFSYLQKLVNRPEYQETDLHTSWTDFLPKGKPQIILYSVDGCPLCQEVELWLNNNWIPYKYVKCQLKFPPTVPKQRNLMRYVGFKASCEKNSQTLFMLQSFPQVELLQGDGKFKTYIANTKHIRSAVEEFILQNVTHYPGFEMGVYGDVAPSEQAAQQLNNIFGMGTKK